MRCHQLLCGLRVDMAHGCVVSTAVQHRQQGLLHRGCVRPALTYRYVLLRAAGDKCLDVGCGIGGPLREIALFSGAHVTGARRPQQRHRQQQQQSFEAGSGPAVNRQQQMLWMLMVGWLLFVWSKTHKGNVGAFVMAPTDVLCVYVPYDLLDTQQV